MQEPIVTVGILNAKRIKIKIVGEYLFPRKEIYMRGRLIFSDAHNGIMLETSLGTYYVSENDVFEPFPPHNASFIVDDVTVGKKFHWEHKERHRYSGSFKIIRENGALTLVNIIPLENYLESVIRSEMNENAPFSLLKAQAVVARSWTLSQMKKGGKKGVNERRKKGEVLRWYERDGHVNYVFCNDDHCQRYHGIGKSQSIAVHEAVEQTRGLVLTGKNGLCDARYFKSCGGRTELFRNVWGEDEGDCISSVEDYDYPTEFTDVDLSIEKNARKWILSEPEAFCNTKDEKILSSVLVDFDKKTVDFYRWRKEYTQEEISALIKKKLKKDYGAILDLLPVERGASGRVIKLKIVGEKRTLIIGKELEIRRTLSETHLYSSAIIIDKEDVQNGVPQKFVIRGAGWGHGVGMCQIGAAVMGEKGYEFDEILAHYYPETKIKRYYK
jgi:SpoIID/LytB domain protein